VGLIGYLAKGAKAMGWKVDYEIVMAVSIPVVAVSMAFAMHHVRQTIIGSAKAIRVRK